MIKTNSRYIIYLNSIFFIFYGTVPLGLVSILDFEFFGAELNLIYSTLSFALFLTIFYQYEKHAKPCKGLIDKLSFSNISLSIQFLCSLPIFIIAPWSEDRLSVFASIAAFVRILWMIRMWVDSTNNQHRLMSRVIMTVVLAVVDGSRTTFFLALVPYMMRHITKKRHFILVLLGLAFFSSLVHFFRIEGAGVNDLFTAGIIGEGFWGPYGVSQVLRSDISMNVQSVVMPFIMPIVLPIIDVADKFLINLRSDSNMSDLIYQNLGETYYPMAGFYLLSEYISMGLTGVVIMNLYLLYCHIIIRRLLGSRNFPFSLLLMVLAIKSSPFTFWKFIWYIGFVMIAIHIMSYLIKRNAFK